MKTSTKIFSATVVIATLAAAGAALAHQGGMGYGPGMGPGMQQGMGPGMMGHGMGPGMRGGMQGPQTAADVDTRLTAAKAALKITAAQETAWTKYAGVMTQLAKSGESMRAQMQAQMRDGKAPSADEWAKQRDTMIGLHTEHQAQKVAAVKEFYAVLTPEQRAIAEEYLPAQGGRRMAGQMQGRMGGHGGGHGGWGQGR
jgi:Spy/CpxP family protein refolding chaperone